MYHNYQTYVFILFVFLQVGTRYSLSPIGNDTHGSGTLPNLLNYSTPTAAMFDITNYKMDRQSTILVDETTAIHPFLK